MSGDKRGGVMEALLSTSDSAEEVSPEQLDSLVYRGKDEDRAEAEPPEFSPLDDSRDAVSAEVWESKATIHVSVGEESRGKVSMNRIAESAVQAIMEELKKAQE